MNSFWNEYPIIKDHLIAVTNLMRNNVKCKERSIERSLLDLIDSGGKMLRPAFLILAGKFGEFNPDRLYPLAAVIEMLHMATLIHDDIVDDSELRRGRKTIQSKYGKDYAVFMGDFLFTRCFMLLSDNSSIEDMKMVSKVIARICVGEIEQYSHHYLRNTTVKQYLKRVSSKTAALFSLSLFIGCAESNCQKALCKKLSRIGYNLGMAFQIIDDILDYTGDEQLVGKSLGNDLKEGIFTLPIIYSLMTPDEKLKELISKNYYDDEDIKTIIKFTHNLGGIEKSRSLARRYTEKAFNDIYELPEGESKEILHEVTKRLLVRSF